MLLEVDIEKRFSEFHCRFDFSLDHEHCGVFGPSGSGKSSLMNMLAGLMRPDRGTIRLNGTPLFDSTTRVNQKPEARKIGVVFQHAHLFPHLNVRKNLFYGYTRTPTPKRTIAPEKVITLLHLEHLIERGVGKLSGGERQRVALGRAILACPDLILLDEPLTGLDATLKYQIIPELRRVCEEFSVPMLFISHDLQEMRMLTEEVLARDQDDLVVERPCLEIIQNSEVIENVQVVNGMIPGNITRALKGEHVGTIIHKQ